MPPYDYSEEIIVDGFARQPIDYWINSFGGCRTNYLSLLLLKKNKVINDIYINKGCHYIKPLKVNVKAGIFCFVEDVGLALSSQISRGYSNYFKARTKNDSENFTIENWLVLVEKQIDNWTINPPIDVYVVNTDFLPDIAVQFREIFGVSIRDYKPRKTFRHHDRLTSHRTIINKLNAKISRFPKFGFVSANSSIMQIIA